MPKLTDVPTPALVLDRAILARNLDRMTRAVGRHGVVLRPHLKTAKSADVARMAMERGAKGITVSTVAEAAYFAEHRFDDILLAVSITPEKLARLEPVIAKGARVTVLTDSIAVAKAIAESPLPVRALIEIDCGEHRSGVFADDPVLLEIAGALGDRLAGVMTHAGYRGRTPAEHAVVAEQERTAVVDAAELIGRSGRSVEVVSVGSTPTAMFAERLDGVTEVRAGVYMFGDLFQAAIGACAHDEIAVTVLASVIGHRVEHGVLVLDAGALALSKDRSTETTAHDAGFGTVWDLDGKPAFGTTKIVRVYQEHGLAMCEGHWPWDALPIGAKVRIAPNHSCITAAAYDRYHVVDGGQEVVAEWGRCVGW